MLLWIGLGALAIGILLVVSGMRAGARDSPFSHAFQAGRALDEGRYHDCYASVDRMKASAGQESGLGRIVVGAILVVIAIILLIVAAIRHFLL